MRQHRDDHCGGGRREREQVRETPRGRRAAASVRRGNETAGQLVHAAARRGVVEHASRAAGAWTRISVIRVWPGEDVEARRTDREGAAVSSYVSGCHRPTEGRPANLAPGTSAGGYIGRSGCNGSSLPDARNGRRWTPTVAARARSVAQARCCCSRRRLSMASAATIAMKARRIMVVSPPSSGATQRAPLAHQLMSEPTVRAARLLQRGSRTIRSYISALSICARGSQLCGLSRQRPLCPRTACVGRVGSVVVTASVEKRPYANADRDEKGSDQCLRGRDARVFTHRSHQTSCSATARPRCLIAIRVARRSAPRPYVPVSSIVASCSS